MRVGNTECAAVIWGITYFQNCLTVFYGRVALVAMPLIFGMLFGNLLHIIIAVGFSQYGCCRDAELFGIALNYAMVRGIVILVKAVAIDDQKLRLYMKLCYGPVHG